MDTYAIILIAVGLALIVGFLKQFGILSGKGLLYAISAVALLFGFGILQAYRKKKAMDEFVDREKNLKIEEDKLEDMTKEYNLSKEEVHKAEAALINERAHHKKTVAEIDAEKEKNKTERIEKINNMSPSELMNSF